MHTIYRVFFVPLTSSLFSLIMIPVIYATNAFTWIGMKQQMAKLFSSFIALIDTVWFDHLWSESTLSEILFFHQESAMGYGQGVD